MWQFFFIIFSLFSATMANPVKLEYTTAELLSEVKQIQPGKPFWVLLRLTLKPGWHSYWINPGDSGLPPQIQWEMPEGFHATPIQWLAPERIPFGKLVNFGYHNESYHLIQITPPKDVGGQSQTLTAKTTWLVCKEICIPEEANLILTLPVHRGDGDAEWSEHQPLIQQLRGELPKILPTPATIDLDGKNLILTINAPEFSDQKDQTLFFFPEEKGLIKNSTPQRWRISNGKAMGQLDHDFAPLPETFQGILQISDNTDHKITNLYITVKGILPVIPPPQAPESLWMILLFALLGGIILNAMPCVFPILSLKAVSIAQTRKSSDAHKQGYGYTLGILVSFILMAGLIIILQKAGHVIGWGFQMQSPIFVAMMTYLMFVIGLSLSGYVYFPLFANSLSATGQDKSFMGSFWIGILAALVATPCTAPFMGVAVGYALVQPPLMIFLIFSALALGFALPYLLLSLWPSLLHFLPKPGPWMETLKEFLAFPMYLTCVWLLWVLIQQIGAYGFFVVACGLVLISFSFWFYKHLQSQLGWWKFILGLGLIVLPLSPLLFLRESPLEEVSSIQEFSKSLIDDLRKQGKPVFVYATASWCITCKFNELTLHSDSVKSLMKQKGIQVVEADWTNQDTEITEFLKSFGRSGVPLYVFYPVKGDPIVLPQLLTESIIAESINQQPDIHVEEK
jgi:thiol:disulfide interchange protein DsbD